MDEQNVTQSTADSQDVVSSTVTDTTTDTSKVSQNQSGEPTTTTGGVDIEKMIQRAVDRATNKLGNENKKLRAEIDTLKKQNMSDADIKALEIAEREADIADREAKLKDKENRLFAIRTIKEAGLDDGSSNALDLVEFVMCDTEDATKARVKAFDNLVKKFVAAEVARTFKQNGRTPEKGGSGSPETKGGIAAKLGQSTADRNAASNKVLNYYIGGKK